ncbi:hypothetical protein [Saccharibacillus sp. JS10]|uniref:hypothetical protein n=1 Tax=Saccharibacillus sp. JS10 TaxID=2950552 RepID=UPI00210926F3|nr:hypothetical protein [Saccharibacillus sp. JS10]MCQ4088494.1 hypothetical protein [Saccharibacillus sp. JS10]
MDFKLYETQLCSSIENEVDKLIQANLQLKIRARSRAGAEISDFLEGIFVEAINNGHQYLSDAQQSPRGATKNPYDAKCYFEFMSRKELIWIDFKAFKISSVDSNPDIGTPNKVINFIKEGNFYLIFVLVYYDENEEGLKFEKYNDVYTKVYPLKDVNRNFRLNPKPQLQVNIAAKPEYRTREEFIRLFIQKHKESYQRQQISIEKKLDLLDGISTQLIESNKESEERGY